jgi:hypothetical protein
MNSLQYLFSMTDFRDKVGLVLHEVSLILAKEHAIEDFEYYDILSRNGL